MRSAMQVRLWSIAVLTVAIGCWLEWPGVSAQSPATNAGEPFQLYVAGDSSGGQFGGNVSVTAPTQFPVNASPSFDDVAATAIGGNFTLVLRADGRLFAVGTNGHGQLGLGDTVARTTPTQIISLPPIVAIAAGSRHSLAVDNAGTVWAWGSNSSGQLGTGLPASELTPAPVANLSNVVAVSAGASYSLALRSDGTVWAWGLNSSRQLGIDGPSQPTPVQVPLPDGQTASKISAGPSTALALLANGNVAGWGSNSSTQLATTGITRLPFNVAVGAYKGIAAGGSHIVLASVSGLVTTRGANSQGQLGNGSTNSSSNSVFPEVVDVVDVAAGDYHSMALTKTGQVYGWGANLNRQHGLPPDWVPMKPTPVTNIPANSRRIYASGNSSAFLNVPGSIGVAVAAPSTINCAQPMPVNVSVTQHAMSNGTPSDIVVVMDSSGSIGSARWNQIKDFAENYVNNLNIGSSQTHVAVVSYSTTAQTRIALSSNKASIISAINNATYLQGNSCVACALDRAMSLLDSGGRPFSGRSIVMVTDGPNTNAEINNAIESAVEAQAAATVYTIAFGANPRFDIIQAISSKVPGVDTYYASTNVTAFAPAQLGIPVTSGLATDGILELEVPSTFTRTGLSVTAGNAQVSGRTITWDLPSNTTSKSFYLSTSLTPQSVGGDFSIFARIQYGDTFFTVPSVRVLGCPASITLTPPTASRAIGGNHTGQVSVLDANGDLMSRNTTVSIVSGPNAGLTFSTTGSFSYGSNASGTDVLVASVAGMAVPMNATASVTWFVPNVAPTVDAGTDRTIALNGSSQTTFTLSGNVSDDGPVGALAIEWTSGGLPVGSGETIAVTRGFGTHTFVLSASDGEFTTADEVTITIVDPSAPVVTAHASGALGENSWYTSDVNVAFTIDDPESGIASSTGCTSQTVTTDGAASFVCSATNGAGASASATLAIKRDVTPPAIGFAQESVQEEATSTLGAAVTFPALSTADATSQVAGTTCSSASGSTFPLGDTTIVCTATDNAGNAATASLIVKVVDTTPPVIAPLDNISTNGGSPDGAAISWAATATDIAAGTVPVVCTPASGTTFSYGTHQVSCIATDPSGNEAAASFTVTVSDPTPPAITVSVTGQEGNAGWYVGSVNVSFSATDAESTVVTTGCEPVTIATDGTVTVTCTATSAGGSVTESVTVKRDATPPVLQVPTDRVAAANGLTAVVTFDATATDSGSLVASVSCSPASGSAFPIGTTPVVCTATDHAGNSAAGGFNVLVSDATPPVITSTVTGTTGSNGWYVGTVQVEWLVTDPETAITSSSNCSVTTVNTDGANQVFTCQAFSGGGSSSGSVTISRDASAPALTTSPNLTISATSSTGANVGYAAPVAIDTGSGVATVGCTPAATSLFAIGAHQVSCTAIDHAGNSTTKSFAVTVIGDTIPPVIASAVPGVTTLSPPNHQLVPITLSVSATDNFGQAPVCAVSGVASNEPQNGLGDGDTPIDWILTGGLTLQLRAERAGGGNGRVYTITVTCTDSSGNGASRTATVSVPKGNGKK